MLTALLTAVVKDCVAVADEKVLEPAGSTASAFQQYVVPAVNVL